MTKYHADPWHLVPLAAQDEEALDDLTGSLAGRLRESPSLDPGGVAAALVGAFGDGDGRFRRAVVCRSGGDAAESLRTLDPARVVSGAGAVEEERPVVFLFPGDGSQHPRMGEGLYRTEPAFRRELERASDRVWRLLGLWLPALLYPEASDAERAAAELREPAVGHAALVAFEVALGRFWIARGVAPAAVLGYSLGEFAAAVVAGTFTLENALALVVSRARLTEATTEGAMLAVSLPAAEVSQLLGDGLSLAAVNGAASSVVSGRADAVAALAARLEGRGVEHRRVPVARGYHSQLLDPILPAYRERVVAAAPVPPRLPVLSSVTGGPVEALEVARPDHWVRHTREPIRFGPAVERLLDGPPVAMLEVGPGTVLTRSVREIVRSRGGGAGRTVVAASCRHPVADEPDEEVFQRALATLWVAGAPVDWDRALHRDLGGALHRGLDRDGAGRTAVALHLESAPRLPLEPRERPEVAAGGVPGAVARIWSDLLGVERPGPDDSFLGQGGDSLVGARLAARLRDELGVRLPLAEILREGTPARLAARVEELRAGGAPPEDAPALRPVERSGPLPVSYGQGALWLVERMAGTGSAYHVPLVLHLEGRLDPGALARSLAAVVARHEALRTRFEVHRGEPTQVVAPPTAGALPVVDLSGRAGGGEAWRRALRSDVERPFDLARGPLLRALLVRRGAEHHVLAATLHHIASDGWSLHLFLRELGAFYRAFVAGEPPAVAPLPVQYGDFAVWQRRAAEGEGALREVEFWRRELAGAPAVELPRRGSPPPKRSLRGARLPVRLDGGLTSRLSALAGEAGGTLFTALLAAFQALLARYSGQDDIVVGTPVAGRDHPATEALIGYFVNTLALRAPVDAGRTFRGHLEASSRRALDALEHRHLPFERVVEALRPGREAGRNPIYQVVLALQNRSLNPPRLPGLAVRLEDGDEPAAAKFDLAVQLRRRGDGLAGHVEYAADLYTRADVERMTASFLRLLAAAVERPDLRLADLPVLAPAEERQLLAELTGPFLPRDRPGDPAVRPVHRLALDQARRDPERLAVAWGGERVTYGDLARRATALARRLRREGVGAESRVGLCLRRSPALVAAALGTLEAGAAYVPLDPDYPEERLAFMVADAGVRVVVADPDPAIRLPGSVLRIAVPGSSDPDGGLEPDPDVPGEETVPGDRLAYVVYTSGSTGRPKGVGVHHRGLAHLVAWHRAAYGTGPGDRATLVASPSFDASVWETWSALAHGASLHVPPREVVEDPARLVPWLAAEGVTVAFLPTPLAAPALARPWPADAPLRFLLTGGDALRCRPGPRHAFRLVNHYGPTESTVVATAGPVEPVGEEAPGRLPSIGRPIAGGRALVLDRHGTLSPRGVAGELCLGGPGLARGYLGRPALTAERFVPDPYPPSPERAAGQRLYRTGDRVRLPPDGHLEFLGRLDRQVKVRGFRVEVGEVEAALAAQSGVSEAAVALRPAAGGEAVLVGYVVPAAAEPPDRSALREGLRRRLPAYMVPAVFVVLDALPLTANGKIDRDLLPAPEAPANAAAEPLDGPVEEGLARIWRSVLGVERVGPFSDFFELGGHSLSASRVAAEVRDAFAVDLAPSAVLVNPVLADLAAAVEEVLVGQIDAAAGATGGARAKGADV